MSKGLQVMSIEQSISSIEQCSGSIVSNNAIDTVVYVPYVLATTVIILFAMYCVYRLIDHAIIKTCLGCKRLKNCEKRLAKLEGKRSA